MTSVMLGPLYQSAGERLLVTIRLPDVSRIPAHSKP